MPLQNQKYGSVFPTFCVNSSCLCATENYGFSGLPVDTAKGTQKRKGWEPEGG